MGKVWPKALRGMRMVVTVMMEEFVEVANYDIEQIKVALKRQRSLMGGLFYYTSFHCTFIPQSRTKWRLVVAPVLSEEDVMLVLGSSSLELCKIYYMAYPRYAIVRIGC